MNIRGLYISAMWLAGFGYAAILDLRPALRGGMIPPILWLMLIALAIDTIALRTLGRKDGQIHPMPMNIRLGGFGGAALLFLGVCWKNGISPTG